MDKYVTLLGAEKVEHAARLMQEAAESIRQSIGYLDDILHRDRMAREGWLAQASGLKNVEPNCPRCGDPIDEDMGCRDPHCPR